MTNYIMNDVRLAYTLPAIGVLAFIARPFLHQPEIMKIGSISLVMAVVHAAQVILQRNTKDVDGVIIFTVVRTILTLLWTFLCVRWSIPCEHFNHDKRTYLRNRWIPITAFTIAVAVTEHHRQSGETSSLNALYSTYLVIAYMWYEAGNFFLKNLTPRSIAIAVPTLYLHWVRYKTTMDNDADDSRSETSNNCCKFVSGHPFLVDLVTNAIIVLAATCYDKAFGMMETFLLEFPLQFSLSRKYICQMIRAFATAEYQMPSIVTEDIISCLQTTNDNVSTMGLTSSLFPTGMRLDLIIIYLFYRVTDNFIDDELDVKVQQRKLNLTIEFLNELFADRKSDYDVSFQPYAAKVNWPKYDAEFNNEELACYRAFSRISFYTPRKYYYDLFDGYQWDIDCNVIRNENDLKLYSYRVGGSFGELCVYVMYYRHSKDGFGDNFIKKYGHVLEKATRISQSLYMVNASRDIVSDSEKHGRCYVLTEFMDDEREELRILQEERKPRDLGENRLRKYFHKFSEMSDKYYSESVDTIECLPRETIGPSLASVDMYRGHTSVIRSSPIYPFKAKMPKWKKISLALYALYVKSFKYVI